MYNESGESTDQVCLWLWPKVTTVLHSFNSFLFQSSRVFSKDITSIWAKSLCSFSFVAKKRWKSTELEPWTQNLNFETVLFKSKNIFLSCTGRNQDQLWLEQKKIETGELKTCCSGGTTWAEKSWPKSLTRRARGSQTYFLLCSTRVKILADWNINWSMKSSVRFWSGPRSTVLRLYRRHPSSVMARFNSPIF